MKLIYAFSLTVIMMLSFSGCSNKKYFEPENVNDDYEVIRSEIRSDIKSLNKTGATLENNAYVSAKGVSRILLPEGYNFINDEDGTLLASNKNGEIIIGSSSNVINLGNNIVAASKKDNLLAIVFVDNSFALYDLNEKKFVFKEYLDSAMSVDTKITNPVFMNTLVLFPSLNGKVIVVDKNNYKILKNIVVDTQKDFNNITFLKVVDDKLVAATNSKIISVASGIFSVKEYDIKDVISHNNNIYVATIDGYIIKLSSTLEEVAHKKYKFAKIYALGFGTKLYALESQGYLIRIDEDFANDNIFEFSFDEEDKSLTIGSKIYFGNKYIELD